MYEGVFPHGDRGHEEGLLVLVLDAGVDPVFVQKREIRALLPAGFRVAVVLTHVHYGVDEAVVVSAFQA